MPLITPEQLVVYLDLPADTAPTDRAQQACDLVIEAVTARAPGQTLTAPYPVGLHGIALVAAARVYDNPTMLRSYTTGGDSSTYAGDPTAILTPYELVRVGEVFGVSAGAPQGAFPVPHRWPDPITAVLDPAYRY